MNGAVFYQPRRNGVLCQLKVIPNAAQNRIEGVREGVLCVRVTATPEDGKANRAVIRLLAKDWGMPQRAFAIVAGQSGKKKTLFIKGDPETIRKTLPRY